MLIKPSVFQYTAGGCLRGNGEIKARGVKVGENRCYTLGYVDDMVNVDDGERRKIKKYDGEN